MSARQAVSLGDALLGEHFHACVFVRDRDEEARVLAPFVREGLAAGEQVVYLTDPDETNMRARLEASGRAELPSTELLAVMPWQTGFFEGASPCEHMLANVEGLIAGATQAGQEHVRIVGQADWLYRHLPRVELLLEFETRVNEICERLRQPTVCCYHLDGLNAGTMMEILRAHPIAVVGSAVHVNPFFTKPAELLEELRSRREG